MRTDLLLLQDILEAISEIIDSTPSTREEYDADKFLRSHLVQNIQIIGEATGHISSSVKNQYPQVPWRLITAMRHAIVHAYFQIDWNEVYNTTINDIPPLKPLFESIITSFGSRTP